MDDIKTAIAFRLFRIGQFANNGVIFKVNCQVSTLRSAQQFTKQKHLEKMLIKWCSSLSIVKTFQFNRRSETKLSLKFSANSCNSSQWKVIYSHKWQDFLKALAYRTRLNSGDRVRKNDVFQEEADHSLVPGQPTPPPICRVAALYLSTWKRFWQLVYLHLTVFTRWCCQLH